MTTCPYADSKYHTNDTKSCIVTPINNDSIETQTHYHTYHGLKYSINPITGAPLYKYLSDRLKSFTQINSFDVNSNTCTLNSRPFDYSNYCHLSMYQCESILDYWNIIYNFKEFWITEIKMLQNKLQNDVANIDKNVFQQKMIELWPQKCTVLDALVNKDNSANWKLLRPVTFTPNPIYFRSALRELMYRLFCNSLNAVEIGWSSRKRRPKQMNCGEYCKMYSTASIPFYNIFGKGNLVHSIICSPARYLNNEWWNLTDNFINYRMIASENLDYDDITSDKNITANKLRSLHNQFKNSIIRYKTEINDEDVVVQ